MNFNTLPRYKSAHTVGSCITAFVERSSSETNLFDHPYYITHSGSAALYQFLSVKNIRGEILLPAYTCDRVVGAIQQAKCQAVFVDVSLETGITSSEAFIEHCTENTKAIIPTVLFGNQIDLTALHKHCQVNNIFIIEDQALSNPLHYKQETSLADATLFSFGKGKLIQFGTGGMLAMKNNIENKNNNLKKTNSLLFFTTLLLSTQWLSAIKLLLLLHIKNLFFKNKAHQEKIKAPPCVNKNLSAFSVSILEQSLKNYPEKTLEHHQELCTIYDEQLIENDVLKKITGKTKQQVLTPFFALRANKNKSLIKYLYKHGFDVGHFFNYSTGSIYGEKTYPNAEEIAAEIILLPTHADVNTDKANRLCSLINQWSNTVAAENNH